MAKNKFDLLKQIVPEVVPTAIVEAEKPSAQNYTHYKQIPISQLVPFSQQPFKPYGDKELEALAESINTYGIIVPIIVRPHNDKYQIISGHNRYIAAKLLSMTEMPADVRELDDDEAILLLIETNFTVRTNFAISEKVKAYKLQYEAIKHQELRAQSCPKSRVSEEMAEEVDDCERRIRQYVKIADLCEPLLELLDNGKLPFLVAYNIAFLAMPAQQIVLKFISDGNSIDIPLSEKIKELGDDISEEKLTELTSVKPKLKLKSIKIRFKDVKQYFNDSETEEEITETILKALEKYYAEVDNE